MAGRSYAARAWGMGYGARTSVDEQERDPSALALARDRPSELEVGGVYWPFPQEALGNLQPPLSFQLNVPRICAIVS